MNVAYTQTSSVNKTPRQKAVEKTCAETGVCRVWRFGYSFIWLNRECSFIKFAEKLKYPIITQQKTAKPDDFSVNYI